ncbi:MAG: TolC family protein, partial [Roseibium sp.]
MRKTMKTALVTLFAVGVVTSSEAETIKEALALAYANNPTLNAARAELRGVDENVPQALAGWRPTVSAEADVGSIRSHTGGSQFYRNNASISLAISQTVFRGFRT